MTKVKGLVKAEVKPKYQKTKRYLSQDGGIRRLSESKTKAKKRVERINMNAKEGGDVYGSVYVS